MLSRRRALTSLAASVVALATERVAPAVAAPRRVIVDSQIHLWPANTPERPWLAGAKPQLPEPCTIERVVLMMNEAGVGRVVIVPPTLEGDRLDYAQEAVRRYPGRFGIMGRINVNTHHGKMQETIDQSAALATYPNVSVKLSSVPLLSSEPYPFRDVTPHIKRLFDAYGPRRCHWGTDVTNSFNKATYRQRITHFTETLNFLSEDDQDWVLGRSIMERLGWT